MGTGKVLGGLAFLTLGIVILVIGIVPIPGLGISIIDRIFILITSIQNFMATFNYQILLLDSGFLSIALIFPFAGVYYVIAGIRSMRYDKAKKDYYVSTTKIGFLIAGFILICIAAVFLIMIVFGILDPSFQFLNFLEFPLPGYPNFLIPIALTMLIIFFVYLIGSKIMKHGVKKEDLF